MIVAQVRCKLVTSHEVCFLGFSYSLRWSNYEELRAKMYTVDEFRNNEQGFGIVEVNTQDRFHCEQKHFFLPCRMRLSAN